MKSIFTTLILLGFSIIVLAQPSSWTKKGVWYVTPKGYHIHQHVVKQYYNAHKLTPEQMQLAASEMNRIISFVRKARSIEDLSSKDFDRFEGTNFDREEVVRKSKNFEPPLRVLYVKNIKGKTIGGNRINKDVYAVHFTYGNKRPEIKKGQFIILSFASENDVIFHSIFGVLNQKHLEAMNEGFGIDYLPSN